MADSSAKSTLVFVVGPPAVGKMTVGYALARRTGLTLFHNHHTIDLVLKFFPFGSPRYNRLVGEFRRRILEEVAESDLPGLIFTYVWAFDDPSDDEAVETYTAIFRARGGRVVFVELACAQEERVRRNETEFRLAEKPVKRNLEHSRSTFRDADEKYQMNSRGRFDGRADYLVIDNTDLTPELVAERIMSAFELPAVEPPSDPGSPTPTG